MLVGSVSHSSSSGVPSPFLSVADFSLSDPTQGRRLITRSTDTVHSGGHPLKRKKCPCTSLPLSDPVFRLRTRGHTEVSPVRLSLSNGTPTTVGGVFSTPSTITNT